MPAGVDDAPDPPAVVLGDGHDLGCPRGNGRAKTASGCVNRQDHPNRHTVPSRPGSTRVALHPEVRSAIESRATITSPASSSSRSESVAPNRAGRTDGRRRIAHSMESHGRDAGHGGSPSGDAAGGAVGRGVGQALSRPGLRRRPRGRTPRTREPATSWWRTRCGCRSGNHHDRLGGVQIRPGAGHDRVEWHVGSSPRRDRRSTRTAHGSPPAGSPPAVRTSRGVS